MIIILHTATCYHCTRKLEEQDWGNAGRLWVHADSKSAFCRPTYKATPIDETITAHEQLVEDDH